MHANPNQNFQSQFSPSIFVWVWGIELSSSSFCSNHFYLLIQLTGPIIHFLKTTRNIPKKSGISDMGICLQPPHP